MSKIAEGSASFNRQLQLSMTNTSSAQVKVVLLCPSCLAIELDVVVSAETVLRIHFENARCSSSYSDYWRSAVASLRPESGSG